MYIKTQNTEINLSYDTFNAIYRANDLNAVLKIKINMNR